MNILLIDQGVYVSNSYKLSFINTGYDDQGEFDYFVACVDLFIALHVIKYFSYVFFCIFSKIQQIISSFCSSLHIELQQRGVEFTQLFGKYSNLRPALLERMPPMEVSRQSEDQTNGDISDGDPKSAEDSPEHIISNSESVSYFIH